MTSLMLGVRGTIGIRLRLRELTCGWCRQYFVQSNILKMAKRNFAASSSFERTGLASLDQKLAMAKRCSREGVMAGAKAAVVASIATAIPTLASVRMLPWARANLNHSAQALIISTVAGAAYFIVADKTVLATARKNSFNPPSNA
ncbi:hypothetical protein Fmac_012785 [Flemingia macrophylla]|uniref:Early nodulin-93-like n=1 Tax=Flemingia macrophylla TaxID=520843 RepID=A0ABD1MRA4_9FABA